MLTRQRTVFSFCVSLLAFVLPAFAQQKHEAPRYDIVIQGGRIVDGTGNPWYMGDIGIANDRIVAIGKIPAGTSRRVIEAKGMVVSPGFIDMLEVSESSNSLP